MMFRLPRIRATTLLFTLILTAACNSLAADLDAVAVKQLGLPNQREPASDVIVSGQPTVDQLTALKRAGVRHVINLRPAAEMDWNEKAAVEQLGMQYHSIPVAGLSDINSANAQQLDQLLNSINGEGVLLHCASGNRVGALRALSAAKKGASVDTAIEEGKHWGMTRLEPAVRQRLNSQAQ